MWLCCPYCEMQVVLQHCGCSGVSAPAGVLAACRADCSVLAACVLAHTGGFGPHVTSTRLPAAQQLFSCTLQPQPAGIVRCTLLVVAQAQRIHCKILTLQVCNGAVVCTPSCMCAGPVWNASPPVGSRAVMLAGQLVLLAVCWVQLCWQKLGPHNMLAVSMLLV